MARILAKREGERARRQMKKILKRGWNRKPNDDDDSDVSCGGRDSSRQTGGGNFVATSSNDKRKTGIEKLILFFL
jgi:hypothetical protein